MSQKGTRWTSAEVEELKTRHAAGESYSQMAAAVSQLSMERTREMVAGKVWRLGLRVRRQPRRPDDDHPFRIAVAQARRRKANEQKASTIGGSWVSDTKRLTAPQLPVDGIHEAPGMRCIPLEDLERGDCKWPLWAHTRRQWDRDAVFYCGAKALLGCSYCEHHAAIAYTGVGRVNTWVNPNG